MRITQKFGLKIISFLLLILTITGCEVSNDNKCEQTLPAETTAVNGPVTANINQEITLTVGFKVSSTCGAFKSFSKEATTTANEQILTVVTVYNGCSCDTKSAIKSAPYLFKASTAGTYILKFRVDGNNGSSSFITKTIVVS